MQQTRSRRRGNQTPWTSTATTTQRQMSAECMRTEAASGEAPWCLAVPNGGPSPFLHLRQAAGLPCETSCLSFETVPYTS